MISADYKSSPIATSSKSEATKIFELQMELASKEPNVATKREHYNTLFKTLGKDVQEHFPLVFKLFEAYATSTCYNQKFNDAPTEEGFRRSAKLMEYSLCLQLNHLNLLSQNIIDLTLFDSLDELIQNLEVGKTFNPLNIDKDVLHQEAHSMGITDIVRNSLIRLAFSYQNIAALNCPNESNISLHKKLDELVEKLLEKKSEYAYNRRPFMVGLEKLNDVEAKINSYKQLLPLFKEELSDFDYERKKGQIFNMLGLTLAGPILRSISNYSFVIFTQDFLTLNPKNQAVITQAHEYFLEADKIQSELLKQASIEELPTQKFLSANVKSSLVVSLVLADKLDEAKAHVEALKAYIEELAQNENDQTYQDGYKKATAIYEDTIHKAIK